MMDDKDSRSQEADLRVGFLCRRFSPLQTVKPTRVLPSRVRQLQHFSPFHPEGHAASQGN